jgi:MOSC domain-containing protein YiiM
MIANARMTGTLVSIFVAERSRARPREIFEAQLVAGKGIVGDRTYREEGVAAPDKELTLVESEQVDGFNRRTGLGAPYWSLRRNLVTRGVDLPALVGRRFRIGDVEAEGLELCEPCSTLGRLLSTQEIPPKRVIAELLHRAGLRARIVTSGVVRAGDGIGSSGL